MNMKILLTGSAVALGLVIMPTSSAQAQVACDLNGAPGVPDGAQGTDSLLCGNSGASGGSADNLTAVGVDVTYSGDSVTLVGSNAIVQSSGLFVGNSSYTRPSDLGATGVGAYSFVSGLGSVAIGDQATVGVVDFSSGFSLTSGVNGGTAVGSASSVTGNLGTAIGLRSQSTGFGSTAVGAVSSAGADFATALGTFASANGEGSVSIGSFAVANGRGALAIGGAANASATGGLSAIPTIPTANLIGAMAVGFLSQAFGGDSTALGNYALIGNYNDSTTVFNGATAIGAASQVGASNATTIGARSTATGANSVAIGYGSVANQANTVSVGTVGGERRIVNVAAGTAATDAVNVSQLTTATAAINSSIIGLQGDVDILYSQNRRQDRLIDKANEGVAMALAMESPNIPANSTFALSGGIGGFQGRNALATAVSAAIGENATVSAGLGYGLNTGEVGYRAGFQVAF